VAVSTGRRPLLLSHASGNPTAETAQRDAAQTVEQLAPGQARWASVRVAPHPGSAEAHPYPEAERREPSRRARSFLFMALGAVAAAAVGVSEVLLCENGFLSVALPLTEARSGGLSTRSTHPLVVMLANLLLANLGIEAQIANPFIRLTKA